VLLVRGDPLTKFAALEPALERLHRASTLVGYLSPTRLLPSTERQIENQKQLRGIDFEALLSSHRKALDDAGFRADAYEPYLTGLGRALGQTERLDLSLLERESISAIMRPHISGDIGMAQLFPSEELWERETRTRVIAALRKELDVTGVPYELTGFKIVSGEMENLLRRDFGRLLLICGVLVLGLTLLTFRNVSLILVAVFPLVSGICLTAATMKLAGLHLNVMNLIAIPMLIGMGIDNGVYFAHLYREARPEELESLIPVCRKSILLTTLTTVMGFGSLVLTDNRGVASMGAVTGLGLICCLLPSFFTVPSVLRLLNRRRLSRA
jgi:predicted exporter